MGDVKTKAPVTRIVVLAAGKGTRMKNDDLPKVLTQLNGKSIIEHLLQAVIQSGVDSRPVIVVGHKQEKVKAILGGSYDYVEQLEQKGTGHAVMVTRELLDGKADNILVLYGDHPFLRGETIKRLNEVHAKTNSVITMMVTDAGDFNDWRSALYHYGRIVKDKQGKVAGIIEFKDATEVLRQSTLLNPGYYCFDARWLWEHLPLIKNNNVQGELYLTDLIKMAIGEGKKISTIDSRPLESLGVNSCEELKEAERLF